LTSNPDLLARFTQEATTLKCEVPPADSVEAAIQRVLDIFAAHRPESFLAWDEAHLPAPGLLNRLAKAGYTRLQLAIPADADSRRRAHRRLAEAGVGITGAIAALADTGSLVLQSGPGRGRLVSLLPPVHIALLPADRLFPTLGDFVRVHPDAARQTANLLLISGPSRTADIEQTLTMGVHGPRELHVIISS